ncbi:hypothetical protein AAG570_012555 [Ranatra chinensis]|uniref:Uncharacterized protein n=1 Tax=Ranatra chinensis TaxID=642074 RepID=A0ABD0YE94_9HEMI
MQAGSPVQPDDLFTTQPPNTGKFTRDNKKTSKLEPKKRTHQSALRSAARAREISTKLNKSVAPLSADAAGPRAPPVYLGREGGGRHWALAPPLSYSSPAAPFPPRHPAWPQFLLQ